MPSTGGISCIECGLNQITEERGAKTPSDCRCEEGFFFCANGPSGGASGCLPCPSGLVCTHGEPPLQEVGLWADHGDACDFVVLRCRNARQCPHGPMGACAEGREGMACNNCKQGHFSLDDGTCQECQGADLLPVYMLFLVLPSALIILGVSNFDPNQQSSLSDSEHQKSQFTS